MKEMRIKRWKSEVEKNKDPSLTTILGQRNSDSWHVRAGEWDNLMQIQCLKGDFAVCYVGDE